MFPDAPVTSATQKLRLQRDTIVKKKSWREIPIIATLLGFSQWKMLGACLVPFAIVGGLLLGASYLRQAGGEAPAPIPKAITTPVGSDAWKKMTDLGQIDQAVQARLQADIAAHQAWLQAQGEVASLQNSGIAKQKQDAQNVLMQRQQQWVAAETAFRNTFELYKKMGGQVDYTVHLPH